MLSGLILVQAVLQDPLSRILKGDPVASIDREGMHIEIHKPELERRVRRQIESGHFHDVDDLLSKALDALEERLPAAATADENRTGADLIAALQASPYRDIDIEPPRYRLPVRDVDL